MASNVENLAALKDLQSMVPPLAHFENLPYDMMGPSIGELTKNYAFLYVLNCWQHYTLMPILATL
jgi:hypothetical protein